MSDEELKHVPDDLYQSKADNEGNLGSEDVDNPQQAGESTSGVTSSTTEAVRYPQRSTPDSQVPNHDRQDEALSSEQNVQDHLDQSKADNEGNLGSEDVDNPQQARDSTSAGISSTTEAVRYPQRSTPDSQVTDHDRQDEALSNEQKGDVLAEDAAGVGKKHHPEGSIPESEVSEDPDRQSDAQSNEQKDVELSEHAAQGRERHHSDSTHPFSPFVSGSSSPLEGAVGGQAVEAEQNGAPPNHDEDFRRRCSSMDFRGLCSGKVDVFNRFFQRNDIRFGTLPDHRVRHNANRHQSGNPVSNQGLSNNNPLAHLQTFDPQPEPLLNQAGAIVGTWLRTSTGHRNSAESGNNSALLGFGFVGEAEHSLGSAQTVPIGDIYTGCFSPPAPRSEPSSRGVSPGLSFPSFSSSRPQTSSDCYEPIISPPPSFDSPNGDAKLVSSDSIDSETRPGAEAPNGHRKRSSGSRPIPISPRGDSEPAGSEGSNSGEKAAAGSNQQKSRKSPPAADSGINVHTQPELASSLPSEDDSVSIPELAHSVESDDIQPMPDLVQDIPSHLMDEGTPPPGPSRYQQPAEHADDVEQASEDESSTEEPDPVTVLSFSPGGSKNDENRQSDES